MFDYHGRHYLSVCVILSVGLDIILAKIENTPQLHWIDIDFDISATPFNSFKKCISYDNAIIEVLYYTEISYQRKGIVSEFYSHFSTDMFITNEDDVKRIKEFVLSDLQDSYEENFIQKFVFGSTFVLISY